MLRGRARFAPTTRAPPAESSRRAWRLPHAASRAIPRRAGRPESRRAAWLASWRAIINDGAPPAIRRCPVERGQPLARRALDSTLHASQRRMRCSPATRSSITVAINGGMQQDRDGAVVPKQPDEIGEAAARCYEAGAAMVHVHARDPQGKNSGDRRIYAEIIRQIRARSPILIQTTNGIGVRRDPATGQFIWPTDKRAARPARPRSAAGPVRHRRRLRRLPQPRGRLSGRSAVRELARAAASRRSRRFTRRARRSNTKWSRPARCIG